MNDTFICAACVKESPLEGTLGKLTFGGRRDYWKMSYYVCEKCARKAQRGRRERAQVEKAIRTVNADDMRLLQGMNQATKALFKGVMR